MPRLDLPTVNARAAGLRLHLFPRPELARLAAMPDLPAVARALAASGRLRGPVASSAAASEIDTEVRRTGAHHAGRLAAWSGSAAALEAFHLEQERRSLRALVRGAAQGAPAEARVAGLLPTPRLPERALAELARQQTPAKLALALVLLNHPFGERLRPLAAQLQPAMFEVDVALLRWFAERAVRAARAGDANLRAFVATRVDLGNVETALAIAAGRSPGADPGSSFVAGGREVSVAAFVDACAGQSRADAAGRLARALGRSALAALVRTTAGDPARLDREGLALLLELQRGRARLDPLGSAPLLFFLLRLEAQGRDLRRVAWGVAAGAPATVIARDLVTPWS